MRNLKTTFCLLLVLLSNTCFASFADNLQLTANFGVSKANDIKGVFFSLGEKVGIESVDPNNNYARLDDFDLFYKRGAFVSFELSTVEHGFRFGAELHVTRNELDKFTIGGEPWVLGDAPVTTTTYGLLANGYMDFLDGWLQPYVGFGMGPAIVNSRISFDGSSARATGFNIAAQAMFGARAWLANNISVNLGVKYVATIFHVTHLEGRHNNFIAHGGLTYVLGQ